MNNQWKIIFLWAIALLVFFVGISMTFETKRQLKETSLLLTRKLKEDLAGLEAYSHKLACYNAALNIFEQLPQKRPVELTDVLKKTLPEYDVNDSRKSIIDSVPGWNIWRQEIVLRDVPIQKIMEFIHEAEYSGRRGAENIRPPWRTDRCIIRSSSSVPGSGHVILQMEALEHVVN